MQRNCRDITKEKRRAFGVAEKYSHSKLKFSDCEFSKNIKDYFKCYMKDSDIKPEEILEALTHIETQTSINYVSGVAKKNSLRNYRVINRGIVLYSSVYSPKKLDDEDKILWLRLVRCFVIWAPMKQKEKEKSGFHFG